MTSIFEADYVDDADYYYEAAFASISWGHGPYDGGGGDNAAVTACGSEEKAAPPDCAKPLRRPVGPPACTK